MHPVILLEIVLSYLPDSAVEPLNLQSAKRAFDHLSNKVLTFGSTIAPLPHYKLKIDALPNVRDL